MKDLKILLIPITLLSIVLMGCKNETKIDIKPSDSDLTELITKQVDSLYKVYERFDYDWIEFFDNNYTAIYPDHPYNI